MKVFAYPTLSTAAVELETADRIVVNPHLKHLYAHLFENGFIEPVREFDVEQLHFSTSDVLNLIQSGDPAWANFVPASAADLIRSKGLFGFDRDMHKKTREGAAEAQS